MNARRICKMAHARTAGTVGILKLKMYLIKHIKFTLEPGRTPPGFLWRSQVSKDIAFEAELTISKVMSHNTILTTRR